MNKLYIKDSTNKIREWSVEAHGFNICIKTGVYGGQLIEHTRAVQRDATKEMNSLINRKKKEGYKTLDDLHIVTNSNMQYDGVLSVLLDKTLSPNRTDANNVLKPMKAKPFKEGVMSYPAYAQPKINGCRCVARYKKSNDLFEEGEVTLTSKEGQDYPVAHVKQYLLDTVYANPDNHHLCLDGELYVPYTPVASISGASRNPNNPIHNKLIFIIFDVSEDVLTQEERIDIVSNLDIVVASTFFNDVYDSYYKLHDYAFRLVSHTVNSDTEFINLSRTYAKNGYEGGILRDATETYKFGQRLNNMLKLKFKTTLNFLIVDVILSSQDRVLFVCKNDINDMTFNVDGIREYLDIEYYNFKDNYIGKKATVEFYERTGNNLPLHGTLIDIL